LNEPLSLQLKYIQDSYNKRHQEIKEEVKAYQEYSEGTDKPKINYPTLDEFILDSGQELLVTRYEKYGKFINPYIIWAAYTNQFTNCTLRQVDVIKEAVVSMNFTEDNLENELKEPLKDYSGSNILVEYGKIIRDLTEIDGKRVQIWIDSKPIKLKDFLTSFNGMELILQTLVNNMGGSADYLNNRVLISDLFHYRINSKSGNDSLDSSYEQLSNKLQVINSQIDAGNLHFSKDYISSLDPKFYTEVKPVLKDIYRLERENEIHLIKAYQSDFSTDRKIYDFIKELYKMESNNRFPVSYNRFHRKKSTKFLSKNTTQF